MSRVDRQAGEGLAWAVREQGIQFSAATQIQSTNTSKHIHTIILKASGGEALTGSKRVDIVMHDNVSDKYHYKKH
jgi:hypothetical protein